MISPGSSLLVLVEMIQTTQTMILLGGMEKIEIWISLVRFINYSFLIIIFYIWTIQNGSTFSSLPVSFSSPRLAYKTVKFSQLFQQHCHEYNHHNYHHQHKNNQPNLTQSNSTKKNLAQMNSPQLKKQCST